MGDRVSADSLRGDLDLILDQWGADMADVPGGASGTLCRDYRAKEAARLVTRTNPGVVSLVAKLRGHERQAAGELASGRPASRSTSPSLALTTLATLMTTALEELGPLAAPADQCSGPWRGPAVKKCPSLWPH